MIKIISDKLPRIVKSRKKLEKELNVKITNKGKEVFIEGSPENEYIAEKVIEALNFGFPFSEALLIKTEDLIFETISIKDYTKSKDLERVRGRIIGKNGKTLKTLSDLTKCFFQLKNNEAGIIGEPEHIEWAIESVMALSKGTKQANVYAYLEKHQPRPILDLGLRKTKQ
jgi:ribosomal RNA assembly protein